MRRNGWGRAALVLVVLGSLVVACSDSNDGATAGRLGNYPTVADLPLPPGLPTPARPAPPAGREIDISGFLEDSSGSTTTTTAGSGPTTTTTAPPPAPPAGSGAKDLLGIWHSEATHPEYGPIITDLVFQEGTYTETVSAPDVNYFFYMTGGYQVFEPEAIVRLEIAEYYPTEWCGPLGCTPINMPTHETNRYTFLDPNTLRLVSDPCLYGGDCTVTYQRV